MGISRLHKYGILAVVVIFAVIYPWACLRHCAVSAAQTHTQYGFVCTMRHTDQPAISPQSSSTAGHLPLPTITQFVIFTLATMRYLLSTQRMIHVVHRWSTWCAQPASPPPKYAI